MDISLNDLTERGQQIYLDELKDRLEKTHMGEHVVIEVNSKKYFVDKDPAIALEKAQKAFPSKLFFMAQVGNLRAPFLNTKSQLAHDWLF